MNIKNFYKPAITKLIILVVFVLITNFIPKTGNVCNIEVGRCSEVKVSGIGYPVFYGEKIIGDMIEKRLTPELFLLNIVIYYSLACLVVFTYKKFKK